MSGISQPLGIGVGQTWQNVTSSRALGSIYTNSSGRVITACINTYGLGQSQYSIDGVVIGIDGENGGYNQFVTLIIPAGSTYKAEVTSGVQLLGNWFELR